MASGDPAVRPVWDCRFLNAPGGTPPLALENGPDLRSNVDAPDAEAVEFTHGGPASADVPRPVPADRLTRANVSFRRLSHPTGGTSVFDFRDFLTPGGDLTDAVQACVDAARTAGNDAVAYFPADVYELTRPVTLTGGGYVVEGEGYYTSFRRAADSPAGACFEVTSPQGLTVRRFSYDRITRPGDAGIRQTGGNGGAAPSRVFYDQLLGPTGGRRWNDPQPFDGLRLESLGPGETVHAGRVNGMVRVRNCARATVLADFVDGQPLIVEGAEAVRDGFIGVLSMNVANLQVRDGQDFVAGDFYTEQSGGDWGRFGADVGAITVTGAGAGSPVPPGRVVLGAAKQMTYDSAVIARVHDYAGLFAYFGPLLESADDPAKTDWTIQHQGTNPVTLLLFEAQSAIPLNVTSTGGVAPTVVRYPGDPSALAAGGPLAQTLDAFAALGRVDKSLHPARTLALPVQTPTLTPPGGPFPGPVNVLARTATAGAALRYTLDGTAPSATHGTPLANDALVRVPATATLQVVATLPGAGETAAPSAVASADYVVRANGAPAETLWPDTKQPTETRTGDLPAEHGTQFYPTTDGTVSRVRVYATAEEGGVHQFRLWRSEGGGYQGSLVAGPFAWTYGGGTPGWITLDIPTVRLTRDTLYVVDVSTGTDPGHAYPRIPHDPDSVQPGNNRRHLLHARKPSTRSDAGSLGTMPGTRGGQAVNTLRDLEFVPDEIPPAAAPPAVPPPVPAAPVVVDNGRDVPTLRGQSEPGAVVRVNLDFIEGGVRNRAYEGTATADATGAWSLPLTGQPAGTEAYAASVCAQNAVGLSAYGPASEPFSVNPLAPVGDLPPLAGDLRLGTAAGTPVAAPLHGADAETAPAALTVAAVSPPAHGTLSGNGLAFTYTPSPGYVGPDRFTYALADADGRRSPSAAVDIEVRAAGSPPANRPPVARPLVLTVGRNNVVALTLAGTDPDGDPLNFETLSRPEGGFLSWSGAARTFRAENGFVGQTGFRYVADDGTQTSAPAAVLIHVDGRIPTVDDPTSATPTLSGVVPVPHAVVRLYDGDTLVGTLTADAVGAWRFAVPGPLTGGVHLFSVTVADPAGQNPGPRSPAVTVTVPFPPAATPTITPASGLYGDEQTVTLATATPGASLRYTLDPTAPLATAADGLPYAGPFSLRTDATVRALAVRDGFLPSAVAAAAYRIGRPAANTATLLGPAPALGGTDNDHDYELGVRFRTAEPGVVTAVRVWRPAVGGAESYPARLWSVNANGNNGTVLAGVNIPAPTPGAWAEAALPAPVLIGPGTTYVVSYSVAAGQAYQAHANGLDGAVGQAPLGTVADGVNGVYALAMGAFPTESFRRTNYYADLRFAALEPLPPLTPFETWRRARFTPAQRADPAVSGPDADPNRNGLGNLLEYALGLDPLAANATDPVVVPGRDADGRLTLTYPRNKAATDVILLAEVSPALGGAEAAWSADPADVEQRWQVVDGGEQLETVTARDRTAPVGGVNGAGRFLRLRASRVP